MIFFYGGGIVMTQTFPSPHTFGGRKCTFPQIGSTVIRWPWKRTLQASRDKSRALLGTERRDADGGEGPRRWAIVNPRHLHTHSTPHQVCARVCSTYPTRNLRGHSKAPIILNTIECTQAARSLHLLVVNKVRQGKQGFIVQIPKRSEMILVYVNVYVWISSAE